ncbi:MAG: energy transducer TonB [Candidatus Cyclobacteriaceae bacterium M3_2C_046]
MEAKKHKKADLQTRTGMFFNIGLVITLTLVIMAFEWKFYDTQTLVDIGQVTDNFEDIMDIPPTEQPPPPPPKIQQPEIVEVPDDEEIEEEIEIDLDVEVTEETVIEEIVFEDAPEEEVTDEVFAIVEDPSEPAGGWDAYYKFLKENMKYPAQARRMGIEGRVFVHFVVERDGSITDVEVLKGIGAGCDEEAIRVIKAFPKWNPGKQRGRPVRTRMHLPVIFKLQN